MATLRQDLLCALRMLRREPVLALVVVLTIGLAIGANTVVFTLVDAALVRPLPYDSPDQLVSVRSPGAKAFYVKGEEHGESLPQVFDWQSQNMAFEALVAYVGGQYVLGRGMDAERVRGSVVTAGFWRVYQVAPLLGRPFDRAEYQAGGNRAAAISYALWQRRFGGDPGALGRTLIVGNEPYTVVAVLPADFRFVEELRASFTASGSRVDLLLPAVEEPWAMNRMVRMWEVAGRLKPRVTMAQARAQMDTVALRLAREYPDSDTSGIIVENLRNYLRGNTGPVLQLLWAAVGLVLVIACLNVCSLLLARGEAHAHESAIRAALGAGRGRLMRHALTGTLLLAAGGGAAGILLAVSVVPAVNRFRLAAGLGIPELRADFRVLCFGMAAALVAGFLTALPAAWRAAESSLALQMRNAARPVSRGGGRLQSGFVIVQIALVVALLTAASLLLRSFLHLWRVDPGFDSEGVLTMALNLDAVRYRDEAQRVRFLTELEPRMRALAGAEAAGVVSGIPMSGTARHGSARVVFVEHPDQEPLDLPRTQLLTASSGFFEALRIPMRAGTLFPPGAVRGVERLCLLNQTMARRYWGASDPTGSHVELDGVRYRVSGVVGDVRYFGLEAIPRPEIYVASAQSAPPNMFLVVRGRKAGATLSGSLRRAVAALDPELPTCEIRSMAQIVSNTVASRRLILALIGGFAALAVILTGVGVHGQMSYFVAQRRREIGIRIALGARGAEVLSWVLAQGLRLVAPGLLSGMALAWMARGLLASQLVGVSPSDPLALGAAQIIVLTAAGIAFLRPLRDATQVDVLTILRAD